MVFRRDAETDQSSRLQIHGPAQPHQRRAVHRRRRHAGVPGKPEEFAHYYKVMSDASAYAEEKGVKLAMKPHGGISGSAEEILRVIKEVNHRNFSIWYDAGNIIHYTGKDPVSEIEPIARRITGFCAKDCGEMKGDVMIQFGAGKW